MRDLITTCNSHPGLKRGLPMLVRPPGDFIPKLLVYPLDEVSEDDLWSTNPLKRLNKEVKGRIDIGRGLP